MGTLITLESAPVIVAPDLKVIVLAFIVGVTTLSAFPLNAYIVFPDVFLTL